MCVAYTKRLCKAYTCKALNAILILGFVLCFLSDLACIVYEMDLCTSYFWRVMIRDRIQLNVFKASINTL